MKTHEIEPLKLHITTKTNIVDHEHLLKRFNVFSGVENVKNFKEIYLPKLESWETEI